MLSHLLLDAISLAAPSSSPLWVWSPGLCSAVHSDGVALLSGALSHILLRHIHRGLNLVSVLVELMVNVGYCPTSYEDLWFRVKKQTFVHTS